MIFLSPLKLRGAQELGPPEFFISMHKEHFEKLLKLIEIEREAEKEENKRELEKYPLPVREALGKTVTRLLLNGDDVGVGGIPLLILSRSTGSHSTLSPFHSMNQGDNVRLSYPPASGIPPTDGTLYDVGEFQATVAINGRIPEPLPSGLCQLDLLGSDATYKRMRQALNQISKTTKPELVALREIFLGERKPETEKWEKILLFNQRLNDFQVGAVHKCLDAEEVALIHGPPGTGKTTVLIEIILQAAQQGHRILASAPSNIAVDNMVEKLLESNLRIVRLGHPARILEALRHVTLSAQQQEHEGQREIKMMDEERHRLMTQLGRKEERGRGISHQSKAE